MSANLARQDEERRRLRKVEDEDHNEIADPLGHARTKLKVPTLKRVVKRAKRDALYDLELEDGTLIPVSTPSCFEWRCANCVRGDEVV